jgi:hypothetical protein
MDEHRESPPRETLAPPLRAKRKPVTGGVAALACVYRGRRTQPSRRSIYSVDEWRDHAGPASAEHWKDGRSAKELAKAWIKGDGIAALVRLLDTESQTAGLVIEQAVAEAQVAFDSCGKRNHDLLIKGRVARGPIVIGLEAKADETFGETVEAYEAKATAFAQGREVE